jgi:hypothetical protein
MLFLHRARGEHPIQTWLFWPFVTVTEVGAHGGTHLIFRENEFCHFLTLSLLVCFVLYSSLIAVHQAETWYVALFRLVQASATTNFSLAFFLFDTLQVNFLVHALPFHVASELNENTNDPGIPKQLERAFLMADLHAKQAGVLASGATVAICLVKVGNFIRFSVSPHHVLGAI